MTIHDELIHEWDALKAQRNALAVSVVALRHALRECEGGHDERRVVVHTPSEIDEWTMDDEYDLLAATWAGKPTAYRPIPNFIPTHGEQARRDMVDATIIMKVWAALYHADNDPARRDRVNADIATFAAIPLVWTGDNDSRLSQAWVVENLVTAAYLVESDPTILEPLLRWLYGYMDWIQGANWFGSEADAKLQIAYFLDDAELIDDAIAYFHFRIAQSLHHPDFDGDTVHHLVGGNNDAMLWPQTQHETEYSNENDNHWNGQSQPPDGAAIWNGEPLPKGCGAERLRDIAHEQMGLYAWANCARTIVANGGVVEPHAHARIRDGAALLADRVLTFVDTGTIPDPIGTNDNGIGGDGWAYGWHSVARYLGDETPPALVELLTRAAVNKNRAGLNHQSADQFVNGA